jgi:uncharacterized integral membrane protein
MADRSRAEPAAEGASDGTTPAGRTRFSAAWVGIIVSALVLILLLVFILENRQSVKVSFFAAHGTMPLGVALLLAAVTGVLLAGLVGTLRIWQLRHRVRRSGQAAAVPAPDTPSEEPRPVGSPN